MTIESYLASVEQLEAFLVEAGMTTDVTSLHREHIETFIVHLTETRSASTAATRYRGLDAGRARHRAGWIGPLPRLVPLSISPLAANE
jgi:site-specific recombinase XerD